MTKTLAKDTQAPLFVIAVFDGVLPSAVAGIRDLLGFGNLVRSWQPRADDIPTDPTTELQILIATPGGQPVDDGQGATLPVDADLLTLENCSAIIIPGFMPNHRGQPPTPKLSQATKSWLKQQHQQGALIGGSCSGVFTLGDAGLLNGKRCTTTWWLHNALQTQFPRANAAWASALIDDEGIISAGGPMSWVDITLHMLKKCLGATHATITADFSIVDTNPKAEALYQPEGYLLSKDNFILQAEHTIRQCDHEPVTAERLAELLAVSPRTLQRRIKKITGESPKALIDRVRLEQACTLLKTSKKPVKEIAYSLGYSDDAVFRRLFRNKMGVTPTGYRQEK